MLADDRPEGQTEKLYLPSIPSPDVAWQANHCEEEHVYPASYNIPNPVPPIFSAQDDAPFPDSYNINNQNDRTYLLKQNYLTNQNKRLYHSYLASPGRTISSDKAEPFYCSLRFIFVHVYAFIIVVIDYFVLPISVVLLLVSMAFMIVDQCSNEILNEFNQQSKANQVTSNCQCAMDHHANVFHECVCFGIRNQANIEQYGLISLFYSVLLVFVMEYLSIFFLLLYALCNCLCCCRAIFCCQCWRHLKSNQGYYVYFIVRIIECAVCWYFMHINSQNVYCQCPSKHGGFVNPEYCGPWQLDKYMEYLWIFCGFFGICCIIFVTGRMMLTCFIPKNGDYAEYSSLIRLVRYKP